MAASGKDTYYLVHWGRTTETNYVLPCKIILSYINVIKDCENLHFINPEKTSKDCTLTMLKRGFVQSSNFS